MATKTQTFPASEMMNKMFEGFTNGFGQNFDGVVKANTQAGQLWMENCQKIGRELVDFYNTRWSSDVEAMRKLAECKDPFQAMQLQADCMQTAMKQYMDEAAKITDMATDASVNCFKQVDEGVRQATAESAKSVEPKKAA